MEDLVTQKIILRYLSLDDLVMMYFVNKNIRYDLGKRETLTYLGSMLTSFTDYIKDRTVGDVYRSPFVDDYLYIMFLSRLEKRDYPSALGYLFLGCNARVDTLLLEKNGDFKRFMFNET